jgi:pyruvate/2-oxoacid:ferredoxin oxidoreductase alpha subunit
VVNRAVGAPWCIWNDHQDSISQRDTGWIQMYCCDHQQIIDTVIKAFALAEAVSVPVMVCYDGYLLSHTYMPFEVPDEKKVAEFLPPFKPAYALDPANPASLNTVTLPDVRMDVNGELAHGYMEIRYLLQEDLRGALTVAQQQEDKFKTVFGRGGDALLEPYRCDDAEQVVVGMGSLTYQLRDVVVLGVRIYRPFPDEALAAALRSARQVLVLEKAVSYGYEGALCSDVKAALYGATICAGTLAASGRAAASGAAPAASGANGGPTVRGLVAGIGGRLVRTADLADTLRAACNGTLEDGPGWVGLKL